VLDAPGRTPTVGLGPHAQRQRCLSVVRSQSGLPLSIADRDIERMLSGEIGSMGFAHSIMSQVRRSELVQ
jgi:hypothetical protein